MDGRGRDGKGVAGRAKHPAPAQSIIISSTPHVQSFNKGVSPPLPPDGRKREEKKNDDGNTHRRVTCLLIQWCPLLVLVVCLFVCFSYVYYHTKYNQTYSNLL